MRELEDRSYAEIAEILGISVSAVETVIYRARRALREQLEGALSCGEAELAISKQADGRLSRQEQGALRAHLRACSECASFARSQRAQRSAFKALALIPLPSSLSSFFGGAGAVTGAVAATAGGGVAMKAAAVLVAGVVVGGAGYEGIRHAPWNDRASEQAVHEEEVAAARLVPPVGLRARPSSAAQKATAETRGSTTAEAAAVRRHVAGRPAKARNGTAVRDDERPGKAGHAKSRGADRAKTRRGRSASAHAKQSVAQKRRQRNDVARAQRKAERRAKAQRARAERARTHRAKAGRARGERKRADRRRNTEKAPDRKRRSRSRDAEEPRERPAVDPPHERTSGPPPPPPKTTDSKITAGAKDEIPELPSSPPAVPRP